MITVRRARQDDLQAMASLLEILFTIETDFQPDRKRQLRALALLLDSPGAMVLVAEEAGRVIGMCSAQLLISTAQGGPTVLVEDLVIHPGHGNRGGGSLLLERIADWARQNNATRLQLLADRENSRALGFYRHCGWQRTSLVGLRRMIEKR